MTIVGKFIFQDLTYLIGCIPNPIFSQTLWRDIRFRSRYFVEMRDKVL